MGYTMQWIVPRTFFRVQYDRKGHFESKTNTCTCMLEDKYYFPWGKQILYMYILVEIIHTEFQYISLIEMQKYN